MMMRFVILSALAIILLGAKASAREPLLAFETGKPIISIAPIPARGHRGEARFAVAHGEAGAAIYSSRGEVLWQDPKPVDIIGFYQGQLVLFRQGEGKNQLERYEYLSPKAISLVSVDSPSPVAPTTLLRTASALLGVTQTLENGIYLDGAEIDLGKPVTALAGAKTFVPIAADMSVIIGTSDGEILLYRAEDLVSGPS